MMVMLIFSSIYLFFSRLLLAGTHIFAINNFDRIGVALLTTKPKFLLCLIMHLNLRRQVATLFIHKLRLLGQVRSILLIKIMIMIAR